MASTKEMMAGAFMQDVQTTLTQGGVPQSQRIELGLLDTIIGVMAMRSGSVKFI